MVPGEIKVQEGNIEYNAGKEAIKMQVINTGDRPVQIGSHYHFYEVNDALSFDRDAAWGKRLDIPSGTAVRFEPGDKKEINLIKSVFNENNKAILIYGKRRDILSPVRLG